MTAMQKHVEVKAVSDILANMSQEDMLKTIELANQRRRSTVDAVKSSPRKRTKSAKARETSPDEDSQHEYEVTPARMVAKGNSEGKRRAAQATASPSGRQPPPLALFRPQAAHRSSLNGFRLSNDGEVSALAGLLELKGDETRRMLQGGAGRPAKQPALKRTAVDRDAFDSGYEEGETTEEDEPAPRKPITKRQRENPHLVGAPKQASASDAPSPLPPTTLLADAQPLNAAPATVAGVRANPAHHTTAFPASSLPSSHELAPPAPLDLHSNPARPDTDITLPIPSLTNIRTSSPDSSSLHLASAADCSLQKPFPKSPLGRQAANAPLQAPDPFSTLPMVPAAAASALLPVPTALPLTLPESGTMGADVALPPQQVALIPAPDAPLEPAAPLAAASYEHDAAADADPEDLAGDMGHAEPGSPVAHEVSNNTKFTGVRQNKGGRFSARIKIGGSNRYIGTFKTAEEAARAFDMMAIKFGRPVETLNFPASHGGPTVGQAYRKRKLHKLYADPNNSINLLLKKLADVDRSNPGILKLTMATLGVPESRFLADNRYSGVRQQTNHWEARIRYKDKLFSMGFYSSVEAAALAWDITAASLQRCSKLNFPEIDKTDLEQQLDALKCVISQQLELGPEEPIEAVQHDAGQASASAAHAHAEGESDNSSHTKDQGSRLQRFRQQQPGCVEDE